MNVNEIANMDALFSFWKEARADYVPFSDDGVLDETRWKTQNPKIAFILKESNDDFYQIRGNPGKPSRGNSPRFWRNINMWSHVVAKAFHGESASFQEVKACTENLVDHIAYINLKKKAECRSTSNDADIRKYVDQDWDFIEKQIQLIHPDILFCCGTYKYLSSHTQAVHLGMGIYQAGIGIIIDFYHPSCRKGCRTTFDRLTEMSKHIPTSSRRVAMVE